MQPIFVPLALMLLLFALPLAAQDRPPLDLTKVPSEGTEAGAFVPSGWKIEEEIRGDLNGDSHADLVLDLIEDLPAEIDDRPNDRSRALLVLFDDAKGRLHRVASSNVLCCTLCEGTLSDPAGHGGLVWIEKGNIIVSQLGGSRWSTTRTQRFRFEPSSGRFLLIGEDIVINDRVEGDWSSDSRNYLTGVKIVEKYRYDQKRDKEIRTSRTTKRIGKSRKVMEDVDCRDD